MLNLCNYRIVMKFKNMKAIRAMFMYKKEMDKYYEEEDMKNDKDAYYEKQELNEEENKWYKTN